MRWSEQTKWFVLRGGFGDIIPRGGGVAARLDAGTSNGRQRTAQLCFAVRHRT